MQKYYGSQVDLVLTSPPYFNQREEYASYQGRADYLRQMSAVMEECYRLLKEGGVILLNIGQDREFDLPAHFSLLLEEVGFQYVDTLCWNKKSEIGTRGVFMEDNLYYPNFSWEPILVYQKQSSVTTFPKFEDRFKDLILANLRSNVWEVTPERSSWHPAPYPERLAFFCIAAYSKANDLILDPFGGSFTTARAAITVGNRRYFCIERNPEYYKQAVASISTQDSLGL